ncbi:basic salivary proline-rich protein 1-like [Corvus cornix cornix]|uniref:basic salivary proline-rich protein 1-like n=1 Tax=Corvus cornix cornix TaxID=932674 RepID=UPI00194F14E5|nr:basic salivary proline-rich protein 1-like [Corvus cornix cornix]
MSPAREGGNHPPPANTPPASPSELPAAPINHRRSPGSPGQRGAIRHPPDPDGAGARRLPQRFPLLCPRTTQRHPRGPGADRGRKQKGDGHLPPGPGSSPLERSARALRLTAWTGSGWGECVGGGAAQAPAPCPGQGREHGVAKQEVAPHFSRPAWHRRPASGRKLEGDGASGDRAGLGSQCPQPWQRRRRDGPSSATWAPSIKFLRSRRVIPPAPQPRARDALSVRASPTPLRGAAPCQHRCRPGLGEGWRERCGRGSEPRSARAPQALGASPRRQRLAQPCPPPCERRQQVHPPCPRTPPCTVSLTCPRADSKHRKLLRNSRSGAGGEGSDGLPGGSSGVPAVTGRPMSDVAALASQDGAPGAVL